MLEEVGLEAGDAANTLADSVADSGSALSLPGPWPWNPSLWCWTKAAALDVQIQRDVLALLDRIGRERGTYLFISHDLDVVASFCNRLIILEKAAL